MTAKVLADASSRALGSLITKHYHCNGLYFDTFFKIYDATVTPVMDYSSAVWGHKQYDVCTNVSGNGHPSLFCMGTLVKCRYMFDNNYIVLILTEVLKITG